MSNSKFRSWIERAARAFAAAVISSCIIFVPLAREAGAAKRPTGIEANIGKKSGAKGPSGKVRKARAKLRERLEKTPGTRRLSKMVEIKTASIKRFLVAKAAHDASDPLFKALAEDDKAGGKGKGSYAALRGRISKLLYAYDLADRTELSDLLKQKNLKPFFTRLVAINKTYAGRYVGGQSPLTPERGIGTGAGRDEQTIALPSYASEPGRALQLLRHVSTLLWFNMEKTKPVEIQTMAVGRDIYIASNNAHTIDVLEARIRLSGSLAGVLDEITKAEEYRLKATNPLAMKDRLIRFRNKMEALGGGTRSGNSTEFSQAAAVLDNMKSVTSATVIDVDFSKKNYGKVSPIPSGSGSPRLFLVRPKINTKASPPHAELALMKVLEKVNTGPNQRTAYIAGRRRACMTCASAMTDTRSRGQPVVFAPESGRLWTNQTEYLGTDRQKLIAIYMALTQPVFETVIERDHALKEDREQVGDESDSE